MEFLNLFSLKDVAIVFTGLVIVSIIRIYYDSYVNRQKAERFGSSLGIYNDLLDIRKEGLLIIAEEALIFSNNEAAEILQIKPHLLDIDYLNTLEITYNYDESKQKFMDSIQTLSHSSVANIVNTSDTLPISISINKFTPYSHTDALWYIIILQDMKSMHDLQEGAKSLLDV